PAYVSTVDSGNLAGHLIALRQALLGLVSGESRPPSARAGLRSGVALALEQLRTRSGSESGLATAEDRLTRVIRDTASVVDLLTGPAPTSPSPEVLEAVLAHLDAAHTELAGVGDLEATG